MRFSISPFFIFYFSLLLSILLLKFIFLLWYFELGSRQFQLLSLCLFFNVKSESRSSNSRVSLFKMSHTILLLNKTSLSSPHSQSLAFSYISVRTESNFTEGKWLLLKNKYLTYIIFFLSRQYSQNLNFTYFNFFLSGFSNSNSLKIWWACDPATYRNVATYIHSLRYVSPTTSE